MTEPTGATMNEPVKNPRSLSDISHLFLSSVRERQTGSAPRPQRTPPPKSGDASRMEARDSRDGRHCQTPHLAAINIRPHLRPQSSLIRAVRGPYLNGHL